MKVCLSTLLLFPFMILCQDKVDFNENNKLPNDVRWVTDSREYYDICHQTYVTATRSLKRELKRTKNPIIVMDIDETVLDNSSYQVDLFLTQSEYNPTTWNMWVEKEISQLVPGAKRFILNYKKYKNARIIYISNRSEETLEATKNNMKKLGIYFDEDIFLLRKDQNDTKIIRRQEVLDGVGRMALYGPQDIIAYFGDAIGDFPINERYQFSKNKFLFPNPMYGKW